MSEGGKEWEGFKTNVPCVTTSVSCVLVPVRLREVPSFNWVSGSEPTYIVVQLMRFSTYTYICMRVSVCHTTIYIYFTIISCYEQMYIEPVQSLKVTNSLLKSLPLLTR